jgi:hypothetical protein
VGTLTLIHATSARLHRQLLGSGHVGADVSWGDVGRHRLYATRSTRRQQHSTRGLVGRAEASQAVKSSQAGQTANVCVWLQGGVVVGKCKGDGVVGKRAEQGSVPRMTGLRMLKEPASSKEVRHGGWMF